MKNIKTILTILLLLSLLTGCWQITLKESVTPDEYYERKSTIESIYPSTQEDVIRLLGEPEWIEKKGSSTYFIYQSKAHEYVLGMFAYLPLFPVRGTDIYCLFLKFDESNHLVEHASRGPITVYNHCIQQFRQENRDPSIVGTLEQEIGTYCPNADLGHADAQKHIGDLYYFGYSHPLKKDLIRAYVWYSLATNGGDNKAAEQVDILTRELSPEQLSEAQNQLEAWEPGHCETDLLEALSRRNE